MTSGCSFLYLFVIWKHFRIKSFIFLLYIVVDVCIYYEYPSTVFDNSIIYQLRVPIFVQFIFKLSVNYECDMDRNLDRGNR